MYQPTLIIAFLGVVTVVVSLQLKELREDIVKLGEGISKLDKKISRIENRLEFSNKIVYVQHDEDLKEN